MPEQILNSEKQPAEKPFPWRCPKCRQPTVKRVTMPYRCQRTHSGRIVTVEVPNFIVPRCSNCGEVVFDYAADEQIRAAFRTQIGSAETAMSEGQKLRRISSRWTWWHKNAFPMIFFGFLGLFTLAWMVGVIQQQVPAPPLLIPLGMAAFGYVLMRWLVFPLADEVWIDSEDIVVRNSGQEERFPITNVLNVESQLFTNPERVILTLKQPCGLGREIVFSPPQRWWRLSRHPIAEELIRRAHGIDENERHALR